MDGLVRKASQLWKVTFDEFALPVKLFALGHGVENPEIGLRIASAGGYPLPTTIVGGEVKIVELESEVLLAPAPIQAKVLHQKAARHHAQTVVHVACLVELSHGRINNRVAGFPFAPRLK